ncbi:MAG: glycosyltransferase involved in cell wall biosynthesis [Psychroserpens sp.]
MKLNFILPGRGSEFMGGFLVMYEYALRMKMKGHQVTVIHHPYRSTNKSLKAWFVALIKYLIGFFRQNYWLPKGFNEKYPGVDFKWAFTINDGSIPDADITIISFWHTAEWVKRLSRDKGKIVYLVQEYEMYMTANEHVKDRMKSNFTSEYKYIAISPAVVDLLESCGGNADAYIPNGVNLNAYTLDTTVDSVERVYLAFPYRLETYKATHLAIEALEIVRETLGENVRIWSFGPEPLEALPSWIDYYKRPSSAKLKELYNKTKIFITPSDYEGWGLSGSEAMACGAALVTTDSGGVNGYATDQDNALISPAGDSSALAENTLVLLKDDNLRKKLSEKGVEDINRFTHESAANKFEIFMYKVFSGC